MTIIFGGGGGVGAPGPAGAPGPDGAPGASGSTILTLVLTGAQIKALPDNNSGGGNDQLFKVVNIIDLVEYCACRLTSFEARLTAVNVYASIQIGFYPTDTGGEGADTNATIAYGLNPQDLYSAIAYDKSNADMLFGQPGATVAGSQGYATAETDICLYLETSGTDIATDLDDGFEITIEYTVEPYAADDDDITGTKHFTVSFDGTAVEASYSMGTTSANGRFVATDIIFHADAFTAGAGIQFPVVSIGWTNPTYNDYLNAELIQPVADYDIPFVATASELSSSGSIPPGSEIFLTVNTKSNKDVVDLTATLIGYYVAA